MQWLRRWKLHVFVPHRGDSYYLDEEGFVKPVEDKVVYDESLKRQTIKQRDKYLFTDPLKCEFKIRKTALRDSNEAEITLWNLDPQVETQLIIDGTEVILEAGYIDNTSIIFRGYVIQPLRGRTNGTDYYLKLICLDGDHYLNLAFTSATLEKNQTRRQLAQQAIRSSNYRPSGILIQDLSDMPEKSTVDGSTPKNMRPKVVFGRTSQVVDDLARLGNSTSYVDNGQLKFFDVSKEPDFANAWEVNTKTGMVGDPVQSSYQISVTILLNPKVSIGDYIHLDNSTIIQERLPIVGSAPYLLEQSGYYRIIAIEYDGDSRGNNWYARLTAITKNGAVPSMLSNSWGNLTV